MGCTRVLVLLFMMGTVSAVSGGKGSGSSQVMAKNEPPTALSQTVTSPRSNVTICPVSAVSERNKGYSIMSSWRLTLQVSPCILQSLARMSLIPKHSKGKVLLAYSGGLGALVSIYICCILYALERLCHVQESALTVNFVPPFCSLSSGCAPDTVSARRAHPRQLPIHSRICRHFMHPRVACGGRIRVLVLYGRCGTGRRLCRR